MTRIHSAAGCALPDGALLERPPFRAPHHQASIVSLVGGGQLVAPARRGQPGHPRRPLPRRARRVPRGRPRGAAPTARGGRDPGEPRRRHRHLPGGLPARGRHEPLPVRRGRLPGRLQLQRGRPRPLPAAHLGAAARPLRPRRAARPPGPRRAAGGACREKPSATAAARASPRPAPAMRATGHGGAPVLAPEAAALVGDEAPRG